MIEKIDKCILWWIGRGWLKMETFVFHYNVVGIFAAISVASKTYIQCKNYCWFVVMENESLNKILKQLSVLMRILLFFLKVLGSLTDMTKIHQTILRISIDFFLIFSFWLNSTQQFFI